MKSTPLSRRRYYVNHAKRFALVSRCATFVAMSVAAGHACAQSSVTLYGLIEDGLQYLTNVTQNPGAKGRAMVEINSGAMQNDRFGLRGAEDLGNGYQSVFTLEEGFNPNTGAVSPPGNPPSALAFSRQAYVGLKTPGFGTFTFGYQYDFMFYLSESPVMSFGAIIGGIGGGPGTSFLDNHLPGVRYANSVKWMDRAGPFTLGAMYSFGAQTPGKSSFMYGFHLAYTSSLLELGMSYTNDKTGLPEPIPIPGTYYPGGKFLYGGDPYNEKIFGAGVKLNLSRFRIMGTFSDARSQLPGNYARNDALDMGVTYSFSPFFYAGIEAGIAWARDPGNNSGQGRQIGLVADYSLSKRTDVYAASAIMWTTGYAMPDLGVPGGATGPSTSAQQASVRVGIRHLF